MRLVTPYIVDSTAAIPSVQCWRDVFADGELGRLEIFCPSRKEGCKWTGQRLLLEEHLKSCAFTQLPCRNAGCSKRLPKSQIDEHVDTACEYRQIECHRCQAKVTARDREGHNDICPKFPKSCPFGCDGETPILREDLVDHVKQCPRKMMEYSSAERTLKGHEVEPEDHMTTDIESRHLTDLDRKTKDIQAAVAHLEHRVKETTDSQSLLTNAKALDKYDERLGSIEKQMKELTTHQRVMQHKTLEACYQSVDNLQKEYKERVSAIEQHLTIMTQKCIQFEELIALQNAQIQRLEEEVAQYRNSRGQSQSVQQQITAQDRVMASHDIKLAEHSLRLDMMDCKNTDGVLLWKITEIRRRQRDAMSGKTPSIYSQPFYTSPNGYKMCARLYLNGDGMGRDTHLSLFFVVMRGEYDSLLPWPFRQKISFTLVDQDGQRNISDAFRPDPRSSSFQKPKTEINIASGCPLFVALSTLDTGGYIKDDAMFIKVVVDNRDLCRPDAR